ncbi:MAG: alternative ribosome rescue aminoacyl-tRNA hydrolase ArfB [Wenzhouxiangellaceae bacterium]|nr:alternative ribosome rescue aminoacyl-tRNA hydrolase ArfB [Wenzhouxiangellaceae bacterium]
MDRTPAPSSNLPPERELEERFVLAGGPGGQHVNRTESAVQLRFDVTGSEFLTEPVKRRLLQLAGNRADSAGVITIEARNHRSQVRNRAEARDRLAALIEQARQPPKRRIPTRPSRAAKKKRLQHKRQRQQIKRARRKPGPED